MADDLRVNPNSSSLKSGEKGAPKDPKAIAAAKELSRLTGLAEKRTGQKLDKDLVQRLANKAKEKIADKEAAVETRKSFETQQLKEKTVSTAQKQQFSKQLKTTGNEKIAKAFELDPQSKKQISGDAKSGPKLPKSFAKASSPQQAKLILGKMFQNMSLEGKPVDLKAEMQKLVKQATTAQKQNTAHSKSSLLSAAQKKAASLGPMAFRGGKTTPALFGAPKTPSPKPGPNPDKFRSAPFNRGSENSALTMRRGPTPTNGPKGGALNQGGGLLRRGSNLMNFNWGAFALKLALYVKDAGNKEQEMFREFERLAQKSAMAGHAFDMAFTESHAELNRLKARCRAWSQMTSSIHSLKSNYQSIRSDLATHSQTTPEEAAEARADFEESTSLLRDGPRPQDRGRERWERLANARRELQESAGRLDVELPTQVGGDDAPGENFDFSDQEFTRTLAGMEDGPRQELMQSISDYTQAHGVSGMSVESQEAYISAQARVDAVSAADYAPTLPEHEADTDLESLRAETIAADRSAAEAELQALRSVLAGPTSAVAAARSNAYAELLGERARNESLEQSEAEQAEVSALQRQPGSSPGVPHGALSQREFSDLSPAQRKPYTAALRAYLGELNIPEDRVGLLESQSQAQTELQDANAALSALGEGDEDARAVAQSRVVEAQSNVAAANSSLGTLYHDIAEARASMEPEAEQRTSTAFRTAADSFRSAPPPPIVRDARPMLFAPSELAGLSIEERAQYDSALQDIKDKLGPLEYRAEVMELEGYLQERIDLKESHLSSLSDGPSARRIAVVAELSQAREDLAAVQANAQALDESLEREINILAPDNAGREELRHDRAEIRERSELQLMHAQYLDQLAEHEMNPELHPRPNHENLEVDTKDKQLLFEDEWLRDVHAMSPGERAGLASRSRDGAAAALREIVRLDRIMLAHPSASSEERAAASEARIQAGTLGTEGELEYYQGLMGGRGGAENRGDTDDATQPLEPRGLNTYSNDTSSAGDLQRAVGVGDAAMEDAMSAPNKTLGVIGRVVGGINTYAVSPLNQGIGALEESWAKSGFSATVQRSVGQQKQSALQNKRAAGRAAASRKRAADGLHNQLLEVMKLMSS